MEDKQHTQDGVLEWKTPDFWDALQQGLTVTTKGTWQVVEGPERRLYLSCLSVDEYDFSVERGREGQVHNNFVSAAREWVYIVLDTQWEVLWEKQVVSNDRCETGKRAGIQCEFTCMDTVSPGFPFLKTPTITSPGSLEKLELCQKSVRWGHEFIITSVHDISRSQWPSVSLYANSCVPPHKWEDSWTL